MPSLAGENAAPRFAGEELSCIRGGRSVFSGLSFALSAGGLLALCGPSGSGKTSALRIMAGLAPPDSGILRRDGAALDPAAHRADLGYAGHRDAVKPALTVREDLAFWRGLRGGAPETDAAAMAAMGIETLADTPSGLLSAGQRRRLALARLAVGPVSLWLLDEPETALDREGRTRFAGLLAGHRAAGGIAVVATHAAPERPAPGSGSPGDGLLDNGFSSAYDGPTAVDGASPNAGFQDAAIVDMARLGAAGRPDAEAP